jgi:hypothetical protein
MTIDPFEHLILGELARFRRLARGHQRRASDRGGKIRPDAVRPGGRRVVPATEAIAARRLGQEKRR